MSHQAFDFLTESFLWSRPDREDKFASFSDDVLKGELSRYREHVLSEQPAAADGLSVAMSARDELEKSNANIMRSVLYFDEVLLPDPIFVLTEWTRDRTKLPWDSREAPRQMLAAAVSYMRELTPLVRLGRVRFIPSTHLLEPPEQLVVQNPKDLFSDRVPEPLRKWFNDRVRLRKVILSQERRERLVLSGPPDSDTSSIMVDFGQEGRLMTYDYMQQIGTAENQVVWSTPGPPTDDVAMKNWLTQSINASAGVFLDALVADARGAWKLGCAYITSCETSSALLDRLRTVAQPSELQAKAALSINLPMVNSATIEQLAELIERNPDSFSALRYELRAIAEDLALIDDPNERFLKTQSATSRLAKEQVRDVERSIKGAQRKMKWSAPITSAALMCGAFGFAASGGALWAGLAALMGSAAATGTALSDHHSYRALPGHFLWKLKGETKR